MVLLLSAFLPVRSRLAVSHLAARILQRSGYDESLGRTAHVIERETGDQRQFRRGGLRQNLRVIGCHDFRLLDYVLLGFMGQNEFDRLPDVDVLETSEKTVSVTRQADIAGLPDARGSFNSSNTPIERQLVGSIEDWDFEMNRGDPEKRQRQIFLLRQALFISRNSTGRPQTEVYG